MFKIIGGVVMCGFGLYGLVKYLERPVLKVAINPEGLREPGKEAGRATVAKAAATSGEQAEAPDAKAMAATT